MKGRVWFEGTRRLQICCTIQHDWLLILQAFLRITGLSRERESERVHDIIVPSMAKTHAD